MKAKLKMKLKMFVVGILLTCAINSWAADPIPVVVDTVKQAPLAQYLWVPGTVISLNQAEIAAEVSGRIEWLEEVGNKVPKDGKLAQIDDAVIKLEVEALEAEVRSQQASINYLQRKVDRLRKMNKQNNVSKELYEEAQKNLAVTRQTLIIGKINLQRKQLDYQRSQLSAPFSGVVVERMLNTGEFVKPGEKVVKLIGLDAREIRANVPMTSIAFLALGDTLEIRYREQQHAAALRAVLPLGDESSHSIEIRVNLDKVNWLPGTPVRVQIPISDKNKLLLVPRDALVLRGKESFVFTLDNDMKAQRKSVIVGAGEGALVSVQGVAVGEKVIVRGAERLREGQEVKVLKATN